MEMTREKGKTMRKTVCWVMCVAVSAFAVNFNNASVTSAALADQADVRGTPNPDPGNISGNVGARTIKVRPRNDPQDFRNLQWAFDNAAPGGTVAMDAGTFFLGDGKDAPRRTVLMRRGLRVVGNKQGSTWRTVIRGGGEVLTPGVGGDLESGPIRIVIENDDHPAVFENIWFREWACEVVFIVACRGFEFRGCRISHPVNTVLAGKIRFVHAIWTSGVKARGDFTVENCLVELGGYTGDLADDEQLLGVFYSNHDTVRVVNNVITGIDEAIEILGNRYGTSGKGDAAAATGPAKIIVTGNRIDVTGTPGQRWPSSFAVLICGNLGVDAVLIENNDITKRGKGWGLGISGENLKITGNKFRFEIHNGEYPPGAVIIGGFPPLAGREMGTSLNNSVFANNTFEGRVSKDGIFFSGDRTVNASHGNRFDLGDSLAKLGAETTLTLSKDIHGNTFKGDHGKVADNSPKGANEY
jgi:hypothetical protein